MRKILLVLCFSLFILLFNLPGCKEKKEAVSLTLLIVNNNLLQFKTFLADSLLHYVQERKEKEELINAFLKARMVYKKSEWATEYFIPTTTRMINGPPLPEIENEENRITDPEGLQVMEEMLYSEDSLNYKKLERQVKLLIANTSYCITYWSDLAIDSAQIFDAVRLELFRVISLGISGFDAAFSNNSLPEAASSIRAMKAVLENFDKENLTSEYFERAACYLTAFNDFNAFDRAAFIRKYAQPLIAIIVDLQKRINLPFVIDHRLLKPDASTYFALSSFDINAYVQDSNYFFSSAKAKLGKKLFHDPILSKNSQRSCASCHQPSKAFTDGLKTNTTVDHSALLRNTPGLLNAALQPSLFYDMRTTNLENQSRDVINNKAEMHGDLELSLKKIINDTAYQNLFSQAFPDKKHYKELDIQNAIASYIRSLTILNSRFDRYMAAINNNEISILEKSGFNLFMGKAKCGTCHFAPLFNGTLPPGFNKMDSEVIGVPADTSGKNIDQDPGRYSIFRLEPYLHAFKITTVRNVSRTAPYMHNGIYGTLEEVVEFYDKGGGKGLGIDVTNQTLSSKPLKLTAYEKKAIVAFLKSLEDEIPD